MFEDLLKCKHAHEYVSRVRGIFYDHPTLFTNVDSLKWYCPSRGSGTISAGEYAKPSSQSGIELINGGLIKIFEVFSLDIYERRIVYKTYLYLFAKRGEHGEWLHSFHCQKGDKITRAHPEHHLEIQSDFRDVTPRYPTHCTNLFEFVDWIAATFYDIKLNI